MTVSAVGSSVVIKGELLAREDVVIAGRVEGTISVEGHLVVVEPGGHVAADVVAKGVVIADRCRSVVAEERIELRSTARVEGSFRRRASRSRRARPQRSCPRLPRVSAARSLKAAS